jgi:fused signal recognition particle receptor
VTEAQTQAMFFIIGLFGLMFLIVGWIILSGQKRKKQVAPRPAAPSPEPEVAETTLTVALKKTEQSILGRLKDLFKTEVSNKNFDEIEEILYTADLGPQTVERVLDTVKNSLSQKQGQNFEDVKAALKTEFQNIFSQAEIPEPENANPLQFLSTSQQPTVWMIVGVNGAGKTTSIGKLAALLAQSGKKVLVAAGDTFRAAAGSQLKVWTDRAQVDIFSPEKVTDPSALAFDAVMKAKAGGYDIVLVDTAGRLHTQAHLMEELKKMRRVIQKALPEAPHETLIVLDANSGQNALLQAKEFNQALQLTGVILTKMDGTAKGGIAVSLAHELRVPIRMLGVGEKIGDLRPFSVKEFLSSLFEA